MKNNIVSKIRSVLRDCNVRFREGDLLHGSVDWIIDFHLIDHQIIIVCCEFESELWEKYVACQDLIIHSGYKCIMIVKCSIPLKIMQLAKLNSIIIVDHNDIERIPKIILGEEDYEKFISKVKVSETKTSRRIVSQCKREILEILNNTPLTIDEILEVLSGRYPARTIKWCISKLKRDKQIILLARVAGSGKAIYGTNLKHMQIIINKYPLSKSWRRNIYSKIILNVLKEEEKGLTINEISIKTGLKVPQIVAIIKHLELKGIIEKKGINENGKIIWTFRK